MRIIVVLLLLLFPLAVHAETKIIKSEAIYIMGDGETPDFAEARALQKAKQAALEEAGTYVQSYTKVKNLDLTTEEIQTVTGGVLQVEVLEKTRSLVAEGLRFYTKIRATVTTDKMEELVRRIKGKNVAEEYTKLQAEYARLSRELEIWKQNAAKTPKGLERNAALDQIRAGEKAFARIQERETELFQRLVSGKQLVEQANRNKEIIDGLLETIQTNGYIVKVGDVQAVAASGKPGQIVLRVPLTIQFSKTIQEALSQAASALGGSVQPEMVLLKKKMRVGSENRDHVTVSLVRLAKDPVSEDYFQRGVRRVGLLLTFLDGTSNPSHCLLGDYRYDMEHDDDWRRIFTYSTNSWKADRSRSKRMLESDLYSDEYVVIVDDEARIVLEHMLPTRSVENLTGVSVTAISETEGILPKPPPACAIVR